MILSFTTEVLFIIEYVWKKFIADLGTLEDEYKGKYPVS